ncbi:hypothetical protein [Chryseobacterium sp. HSC-36S06]|uniref:hypothetical protein n=1 Tax=Chryseobacterium sp. HSC-36S06 TaxID=2910970 RepID=UPI0020A05F62|nr:hypothetical protein [Chryseobacterium sp. HSC-36S06]MCP2037258.1 hypothetical protein [Chryseobacterium sp. HSC-36S06]
MKKILFLLTFFAGLQISAQQKSTSEKMLEEIQYTRQSQGNLKLVWWIPADYWELAIGENGGATPEQIAYIKDLLEEYTIIIAGDYTINGTDFKVNKLNNGVTLYGLQGEKVPLLKDSQIDGKVAIIINEVLKPLFTEMAGKMGSGMSFFVYNNKKDGKIMIDPRKAGEFKVEVNKDVFTWQLPLVSLLSDKTCPVNQEKLPGNYVYCPIHGNKL